MFSSRNKKNNVYPCEPQFYYIKVGCKGVKLNRYVFVICKTRTLTKTYNSFKPSHLQMLNEFYSSVPRNSLNEMSSPSLLSYNIPYPLSTYLCRMDSSDHVL